ncbi:MAG TPA: DUF1573 domain-containing protein [Mucilaginibacter sp.]|nr:DUF1573 domain-containing protein [Mucilaginibacter sp.]
MKTFVLSLLTAGILLVSCNSNQKASSTDTTTTGNTADVAIMKFDKDTHDFGKIQSGDSVIYDFKFTNTGKAPLIITDAIASCGCTKPEWPKTPVKPGENGMIHVVFNSSGKVGLQDKLITVTANTNPPQNRVHLIGEVTLTK